MENTFMNFYSKLIKEFEIDNNFEEIRCKTEKIKWPNASGVYLVWKSAFGSIDDLLYIGMTGKFKRNKKNEIVFNSGTFDKRKSRWTPYRFCEDERDGENYFSFKYGPKYKLKEQGRRKYEPDAYRETIEYSKLTIHCFLISANHNDYTPELLEKEMLTKYLKYTGTLPLANNEL